MRKVRNHRNSGFTILDNQALDDRRLAIADIGVLAEYLRCSDGWNVTLDAIAKRHPSQGRRGCGREAIGAAFRNLNDLGYIVKVIWRNAEGQWNTAVAVYPTPATRQEVDDVIACEVPRNALDVRCVTPHLDAPEEAQVSDVEDASSQVSPETRLSGSRGAAARCAVGLYKTSRKTSSSSSSPSAGAPEEAPERPLRGPKTKKPHNRSRPAAGQTHVNGTDATDEDQESLRALLAALKLSAQGQSRGRLLKAVSALRRASWTQAEIEAIFEGTNWPGIDVPARFMAVMLEEALLYPPEPTGAERDAALLAELEQQLADQKRQIAACDGCGPFGRTLTGWHGHGDEGLRTRIYELTDPEQAAFNRASNGVRV